MLFFHTTSPHAWDCFFQSTKTGKSSLQPFLSFSRPSFWIPTKGVLSHPVWGLTFPKRNKVPLGLALMQFWNQKINYVSRDRSCIPCHNWSIKMARIIWFGSTSVDIGPAYINSCQRLGRLCFWVSVKVRNSLKLKHILSIASKRQISAIFFFKVGYKYGLYHYLPQAQRYIVPLSSEYWEQSNLLETGGRRQQCPQHGLL